MHAVRVVIFTYTALAGGPDGGLAILLPQNMGAKIVRRYVQDELNALWVRIPNSVDIVAVYVRPGAEREEHLDVLWRMLDGEQDAHLR